MNKLIIIALALTVSANASAISFSPESDCGVYQVRGYLAFDSNDNMTLKVKGDVVTTDLVLVGKGLDKALAWEGQEVSAEVFLPAKMYSSTRATVVLQKWLEHKLSSKDPIVMQAKKDCKNEVQIKWKEAKKATAEKK